MPALLCATLRAKAKAGLLPASRQAAPLPASPQAAPAHQEVGSPEAGAAVEVEAATALPQRRLRALADLLELGAPGRGREEADRLKAAAARLAGGSCAASRPLVMLGRKAGQGVAQQSEVSRSWGWQLDGVWGRTGRAVVRSMAAANPTAPTPLPRTHVPLCVPVLQHEEQTVPQQRPASRAAAPRASGAALGVLLSGAWLRQTPRHPHHCLVLTSPCVFLSCSMRSRRSRSSAQPAGQLPPACTRTGR